MQDVRARAIYHDHGGRVWELGWTGLDWHDGEYRLRDEFGTVLARFRRDFTPIEIDGEVL